MTTTFTDANAARTYLDTVAKKPVQDLQAGDELGGKLVELDIAKCRLYARIGLAWVEERPRIQHACELLGVDEDR